MNIFLKEGFCYKHIKYDCHNGCYFIDSLTKNRDTLVRQHLNQAMSVSEWYVINKLRKWNPESQTIFEYDSLISEGYTRFDENYIVTNVNGKGHYTETFFKKSDTILRMQSFGPFSYKKEYFNKKHKLLKRITSQASEVNPGEYLFVLTTDLFDTSGTIINSMKKEGVMIRNGNLGFKEKK